MNEKIIAMVGRSPGIKTGQIADQLDVDFEEAERLLNQLVQNGTLKCGLVPMSGGGKVNAYELTEVRLQRRAAPAAAAQAAPAAAAPQPAQADQEGPSKAALAMDFLRSIDGPATSAELSEACGLAEGQYLSSSLASAIRAGKIVRDGDMWTLGDGEPPARTRSAPVTRCCMWSDGVLEIQRDGVTLATFDAAEQKLLKKALGYTA